MEKRNRLIRAKSDRLSSLPDDLLCHVLSFLPTKSSVATSILATRYRYLWHEVVNLDFDDHGYYYGNKRYSFSGSINRVMLLRSNFRDINTFSLVMRNESFDDSSISDHQLLDNWIRYAIARNVQVIDMLIAKPGLPRCLFTCRTLVDLSLHHCRCGLPDAILLPNLKKLHLYSVNCGSDKKYQDLISGCPVLEELDIYHYLDNSNYIDDCVISSPTIKWLTLDFERRLSMYHLVEKLEINTPALRYLNLSDKIFHHISAGVLNSLVEASISLNNDDDEEVDSNVYSDTVLELVERLRQVKYLKFSTGHEQFLDSSSFTAITSKFINLTKLEWGADWLILLKFLEFADNLQVLIIRDPIIREIDYSLKCVTKSLQVPTCLSSHLREVTVDPFGRFSENVFEMVSYILKHGKVLNEMKINAKYLRSNDEKFSALRRISEFERGSHTCKLKFS